ncbi:MAG: hypothetical protein JWO11_1988 [Nocardioides sp.]|nr:hypothetical protein [Nocardioides sp.]
MASHRHPLISIAATIPVSGLAVALILATGTSPASAAPSPVGLGAATSFAVLAGTTVTNTGPSMISGDLGVSPGTAVTGFPPGIVVNGAIHSADALALQAQNDLTTAYNDAAARGPVVDKTAEDLGGQTLVPGVYGATTGMALTGTVRLDAQGDPNAVFIFQAGTTLVTASNSNVALIGGALPCNVYWQVGSSATLGTGTNFAGNVLALTSVTVTTSASVRGRILARNGAVTLDTNSILASDCASSPPPATVTATATVTESATATVTETATATATVTETATAPATATATVTETATETATVTETATATTTVTAAAAPAATVTVTAPAGPVPTVTVTAPAGPVPTETVTAPAPTVTVTAPAATMTVTATPAPAPGATVTVTHAAAAPTVTASSSTATPTTSTETPTVPTATGTHPSTPGIGIGPPPVPTGHPGTGRDADPGSSTAWLLMGVVFLSGAGGAAGLGSGRNLPLARRRHR